MLCIPNWPGTIYIDKVDLEFIYSPAFLLNAGLKVLYHHPWSIWLVCLAGCSKAGITGSQYSNSHLIGFLGI